MSNILEGLRIVEGSAFVAAPSGGMHLAQLGADVIRFDTIGGGIDYRRLPLSDSGHSLYWASLNRGKRSIAADIRSDAGRELLAALITAPGDEAGLFLSNFPDRGWMSYESLATQRADLIKVTIKGNPDGSTALDYTVNAAVGYPMVTGPDGIDGPINHVLPAWDFQCGQQAALGLLAAERFRTRNGTGQHVEISLADVAMSTVANYGHVAEAQINGTERGRIGNDLYGAFGRDFATSDGRRFTAIVITSRQWKSLLEATGIGPAVAQLADDNGADFSDEGALFEHRAPLGQMVDEWAATQTLAEVAAVFDEHGVCWGPYQTFGQMLAEDWRCSPKNPMFELIDQPDIGQVLAPGSPLAFSGIERGPVLPAPRLGEHTEQILADVLGLSGAEIGALHDGGTVASAAAA